MERRSELQCGLMPNILVVIVIVLASSGRTDAEPTRDWHAGLNLRTELATHPLRFDGGVRLGRLDLVAVVDPLFWIDGQHDVDVLILHLSRDRLARSYRPGQRQRRSGRTRRGATDSRRTSSRIPESGAMISSAFSLWTSQVAKTGTSWRLMLTHTLERLWAVWGTSANDVFTIGDNGAILHFDGSEWSHSL